MVMPRSRSRSSWSSTCSTMSRGATVPVYSRRRSDSVVFPWSTCAITEIARVSLVGVDTRRSLSGIKKGPARMSRPFGPVGYLLGRSSGIPSVVSSGVSSTPPSRVVCGSVSAGSPIGSRPPISSRSTLGSLIIRYLRARMISVVLPYHVSVLISSPANRFPPPPGGGSGVGPLAASRGPGGAGKTLGDATELPPASRLDPVRQDHIRHLVDLGNADLRDAAVGGQRLGGLASDQVGPMAVNLEADIQLSECPEDAGRHHHVGEAHDCLGDAGPDLSILVGEALAERRGVGFPFLAALDDLNPLADVLDAFHVHRQPESIQQLRPQITFLRIHGAHQDETRRVPDRNPLALDHVDPHGRGIEQDVDQMVVEQVDLVDIQNVAVRLRQHARLEAALAALDGGLDVDRAHHPVLRGIDRQLNDSHPPAPPGQRLTARDSVLAIGAEGLRRVRVASVGAVGNHRELRKQSSERAYRRRFPGALLAADQDAANRRMDSVQDERELHLVLADDRAERIDKPLHQAEPVLSISRWTLSTIALCDRSKRP